MLLSLTKTRHLSYATRQDWGAHRYRLKQSKLCPPVGWVRLSYTGTGRCQDPYSCGKMVRAIQETYLDNGFWDMPQNFLVGGDGVVYEGRSWVFQPDLPPEWHQLEDDCVDIAFIGDFTEENPPWEMVETAMNYITYGVTRSKNIKPTFRVIPLRNKHNEEQLSFPSETNPATT